MTTHCAASVLSFCVLPFFLFRLYTNQSHQTNDLHHTHEKEKQLVLYHIWRLEVGQLFALLIRISTEATGYHASNPFEA